MSTPGQESDIMLEVIDKGQSGRKHPHPLLFVHGGFQGAWSWDAHFLDFFADYGFRVLAPSLRGHGLSPADKPLRRCSISDYVDDVASVADALTAQPIPIGHSMGGFVVQKYLESRDAPAAVLLASTPPHGHLRFLLRTIRQHPWRSAKFTVSGRPDDLYGGTLAGARELFFAPTTPDSVVREGSERLQPDSTRAVIVDMVGLKLVDTARITTPLLVLGGELDAIYHPATCTRRQRSTAPTRHSSHRWDTAWRWSRGGRRWPAISCHGSSSGVSRNSVVADGARRVTRSVSVERL